MTDQELAAALRKCGRVEGPGDCVACRFYKGDDPALCIPKMTAACADALENSESHVMALQQEIEKLRGQLILRNDELLKLRARAPQWVSVEERLPEEDRCVVARDMVGVVSTAYYNSSWHGMLGCDAVTHWMHLPEPPKEAKEDG